MRAGLRHSTFSYIEGIISSYEEYPRWIKRREEEIIAPYMESDTNQGGGRSNRIVSKVESTVTRILMDKQLQSLREEYQAVSRVMRESDKVTQEIIRQYYMSKPRTKTWQGIADDVKYSKKQCYRIRDAFVKRIAEELGKI